MGLMNAVKSAFCSPVDDKTLYVEIEELPRPRDWGTVEMRIGKKILGGLETSLDGSALSELLGWIEMQLGQVNASGYERVEYSNVSEALQYRINQVLNSG